MKRVCIPRGVVGPDALDRWATAWVFRSKSRRAYRWYRRRVGRFMVFIPLYRKGFEPVLHVRGSAEALGATVMARIS